MHDATPSRATAFRGGGHGPPLLLSLLLAAGAGGCRRENIQPQPQPLPPVTPSPELTAGHRAFLRGQTTAAAQRFLRYRAAAANDAQAAEASYWLGLCELRDGTAARALPNFDRALRPGASDEVTALTFLAAAHGAYRSHELDRALGYLGRLTDSLRPLVPADEVLYRQAMVLRRKGRWGEAISLFRRIATRFRDSPRAAEAWREARRRQRYFACQIGWFGKRQNAERLVATARRKGYAAIILPGVRSERAGFAVMVGRYARHADARLALERLRGAGLEAFVVP